MSNFPPERIEDALKFCCCSPYRDRQICIYAGGGSTTQHDMHWGYIIYDEGAIAIMKKFDWFTALVSLAIAENTIYFIIQGGWFAVAGIIFGGIWAWIAYWDWKRYQTIKSDHEEAILSFLNSDEMQSEGDKNNWARSEIEAITSAYGFLAARDEVSVDEFAQILNGACKSPRFIGDLSCSYNARSPYLRCAIKPSGPCDKCQFYAEI